MTTAQITELLELIAKVVNDHGTWKEKRDAVLDEASGMDKNYLEEFASWFATQD
jgi:hypothetical protein